MKQFVMRLYGGYGKTKASLVLAVILLYAVLCVFSGGSVWQLLLVCAVAAGYIVLPGLFFADVLQLQTTQKNMYIPLALLLGSGFFAVVYCFAMRLHILWLLHLLPPLLGAAWACQKLAAHKNRNGRFLPHLQKGRIGPKPHQWMMVLLFAALLLLFAFYGVAKNGRPLAVGNVLLNQDLLWNVGNANSFKIAFPPQDIRFVGVRLKYHYLTEMLCGALSIVSGVPAYNIAAFYMQPLMLAALVLCLYCFARTVWPHSLFKSVLFPYALFLFSCASLWKILPNGWSVFWNSNITHLITNINGQTTAVVYLCVFSGLLFSAMRQKYRVGLLHYALCLCAFVMLSFAKGPIAAIVACSLFLTLLLGLFVKKTTWRGALFGLLVCGLFVYIYLTMFSSGANTSMPFSFHGTLDKAYFGNILNRLWQQNHTLWVISIPVLWVVQSFLMMPATFPLYLRGLAGDVRHFGALAPGRMFSHGVAIGGLLAYYWFNHPSMSQSYFLFGAIFFICLVAVDNIDALRWPAKGSLGRVRTALKKGFVVFTALFAAVGFVTTGFLYIHMLGSGARQVARNLGIQQKYPYDVVVTPDDEAAMLWMRDNTPKDAMFATNRIHTGARREGISNVYSAFNERQGYMEGFSYAKTNMGVSKEVIEARLAINNTLFSTDTPAQEILRLCRENDISYLVYSTQMDGFDGSDAQLAFLPLVFDAQTVRIYSVPHA